MLSKLVRQNGAKVKISRGQAPEESRLYQLGGGQQPARGESDETLLHPEERRLHNVQQTVTRNQRNCSKNQRPGEICY